MVPRFIPAHAGNSHRLWCRIGSRPVHPRACGELKISPALSLTHPGSSPRMRGTRIRPSRALHPQRFIPAHAGNSHPQRPCASWRSVHPRACGELSARCALTPWVSGSSPRMRGTLTACRGWFLRFRFIPAHAGNSQPSSRATCPMTVHPRACGELTASPRRPRSTTGSSPRMRGTHGQSTAATVYHRFIPAHAGNSRPVHGGHGLPPVHPRACGELIVRFIDHTGWFGSSPRMRGTRAMNV